MLIMYVKVGTNIPATSIAILLLVSSGGTAQSSQPMEGNWSDMGKGSVHQPKGKELLEKEHQWCCFGLPRFFMLGELCMIIAVKVEDACGWFDDNKVEEGVGVYIGGLLAFLGSEGVLTLATFNKVRVDAKRPVHSKDNKIVGFCFRPLSRKAVNHWAANFLARERDKGKKTVHRNYGTRIQILPS